MSNTFNLRSVLAAVMIISAGLAVATAIDCSSAYAQAAGGGNGGGGNGGGGSGGGNGGGGSGGGGSGGGNGGGGSGGGDGSGGDDGGQGEDHSDNGYHDQKPSFAAVRAYQESNGDEDEKDEDPNNEEGNEVGDDPIVVTHVEPGNPPNQPQDTPTFEQPYQEPTPEPEVVQIVQEIDHACRNPAPTFQTRVLTDDECDRIERQLAALIVQYNQANKPQRDLLLAWLREQMQLAALGQQ